MKKLLILSLIMTCLLTACWMSDSAAPHPLSGVGSDSAAVYQDMAYEEMFNGSLAKAEAYARSTWSASQRRFSTTRLLSIEVYRR